MKLISCMLVSAVIGTAMGAAAGVMTASPKVKRMCKLAKRKVCACAHKMGM